MNNDINIIKTEDEKLAGKLAICQDVLNTISIRNISHGVYCTTLNDIFFEEDSGNAQDYLEMYERECQVCALGSCFLSYIKLFNSIDAKDMIYGHPGVTLIIETLKEYFTLDELREIEYLFENTLYGKIINCKDNLKIIMETIIKHNGDIKGAVNEIKRN